MGHILSWSARPDSGGCVLDYDITFIGPDAVEPVDYFRCDGAAHLFIDTYGCSSIPVTFLGASFLFDSFFPRANLPTPYPFPYHPCRKSDAVFSPATPAAAARRSLGRSRPPQLRPGRLLATLAISSKISPPEQSRG